MLVLLILNTVLSLLVFKIYNCLFAIYLGLYFNLSFDEIQKGLIEYFPSNNRMDIRNVKGLKIINDSYNANPDAMKAALGVLMDFKQGKGRAFGLRGQGPDTGLRRFRPPKSKGRGIRGGTSLRRH